ncbi:hypothetical protein RN001_007972 [Aquatica leii]|uniref:G-protein coupled receptors family 2 profile 2 domain-containing protein n=1 Tax=Aquatica leii TaxID=1421715 RepID=A0AAN7S9C9_9COLE|nr:hypothetical protein RN001_007972 [Aquatica leii]
MTRFYVFLCCVTYISYSHAFIEQLVYNNENPKCCDQDDALTLIGPERILPYQCVFDVNRTSHILVNGSLQFFPWSLSQGISCIDNFIGDHSDDRRIATVDAETYELSYLSLKYFPKCCPVDSSYDLSEHGCVAVTNETGTNYTTLIDEVLNPYLNKKMIHLSIGLSKCKFVIADYEIPVFSDILYQTDQSIILEKHNKNFQYNSYCIDKVYNSDNFVVRSCEDFSVCKSKIDDNKPRCIRKCCADGYYYKGGSKCKFGFTKGLSFYNDSKVLDEEEPFSIIHGHSCRHYIVPLDWNYTLDEMGYLNLDLEESNDQHSPFETSYCFEEVDIGITQGRRLFLCFKHDTNESVKYQVSRICLVFSSIFLILTLLGYICVPEMQNLHGKTLMCNCGSLLVAFTILAVLQFYPTVEGPACKFIGYIVMYTFLAAFMWSNVMCFDIWWTFGSMRVDGINQKKRERRRFLYYCLYSWTIPLVITLTAFSVQCFKQSLPESMKPFVPTLGEFSCFFEESTNLISFLMWFMLPIAIVCGCNLVFFIKTIIYCYKVKAEIERMKDSQLSKNECNKILSADKERLRMVVKLFLVMGIPWLFESISASLIPPNAVGSAEVIEIVFDTINSLQGFFIFCVFILKPNFFKALKKRLTGKQLSHQITRSNYSAVTASSYVTVPTPKIANEINEKHSTISHRAKKLKHYVQLQNVTETNTKNKKRAFSSTLNSSDNLLEFNENTAEQIEIQSNKLHKGEENAEEVFGIDKENKNEQKQNKNFDSSDTNKNNKTKRKDLEKADVPKRFSIVYNLPNVKTESQPEYIFLNS